MDRFKFRVWDKKANRMSPPFALFGEFTLIGGVHAWQDESGIPGDSLGRLNDLEVMQYIGHHDSNGNDICEGDIVKMGDTTATVVYWGDPPEFDLDPHDEDKWCDDWNLSDDSYRMTIIGNIYESKL